MARPSPHATSARKGYDGKERTTDERTRMCLRKVRFPDEYVARARCAQLIEQGRADSPRLFVYQCPVCRGWHMTGAYQLNKTAAAVTADDMFANRGTVKPQPAGPT